MSANLPQPQVMFDVATEVFFARPVAIADAEVPTWGEN